MTLLDDSHVPTVFTAAHVGAGNYAEAQKGESASKTWNIPGPIMNDNTRYSIDIFSSYCVLRQDGVADSSGDRRMLLLQRWRNLGNLSASRRESIGACASSAFSCAARRRPNPSTGRGSFS